MEDTIPTQMEAAVIDHYGGPEVVHVRTVPVPELEKDESLIAADTAGVGVWDPWIREGGMGRAKFPLVIGMRGRAKWSPLGPRCVASRLATASAVTSWT